MDSSYHVHPTLPTLPFDSCYEILSRTSLETLERCKLVSKEWKKATFEHSFTNSFCENTKAIYGFFIQNIRNNRYISSFIFVNDDDNNSNNQNCKILSLNFIKGHDRSSIKIEASTSNGLLLCSTQSTKSIYIPEYFICKPTTKQFVKIPNPKTSNYHPIKFGLKILKSNPLHYKIFRFSEYKEHRIIKHKSLYYKLFRCDIFDSNNWSWKKLEDIRLQPYDNSWIDFTKCEVSTNGVFHWLMPYDNKIFAFDLIKETWELFELPKELWNNVDYDDFIRKKIIRLVKLEGQLGLTCERQDKQNRLELWVMDNYSKKTWNKKSFEVSFDCECGASFATFCNSDMVIMKGIYNFVFYNLQDCSFIKRVKVDNCVAYGDLFPLISDYKPIDGLNNETKLLTRRSNSVEKYNSWLVQQRS